MGKFERPRHLILSSVVALGLASCEGVISWPGRTAPGPGPNAVADLCEGIPEDPFAASTARLRRMSPEQYGNTVKDVLSLDTVDLLIDAPRSEAIGEAELKKLQTAAAQLVALKKHHAWLPSSCPVSGSHSSDCARQFIDAFGRALYRRALEPEEKATLYAHYEGLKTATDVTPGWTFEEAVDILAEVMLQGGPFLYLQERGVSDPALPPGINRLTGYERATRLAYLLWNTTPDAQLLEAAAAGELDTSEGLKHHAERLLASPRARTTISRFAQHWLGLDATVRLPALENVPKNAVKFPDDSPELRVAMREESGRLYEKVFFEPASDFRQVFTSTDAYVNGDLAKLYGVTNGPTSPATWAWVKLDATQRAGLLTRAAFNTHLANANDQSPINRGVHIYRNVLCQSLSNPPANVDNTPPANTSGSGPRTVRELTELKTSGLSCQGCHGMINPLGFTLENYDALGHYQAQEKGTLDGVAFALPVNTSAVVRSGDLSGTIADGPALSAALAQSAMAHDCQISKWYERAYETRPTREALCALGGLRKDFQTTHDLRGMLTSLISSGPGLYVKAE